MRILGNIQNNVVIVWLFGCFLLATGCFDVVEQISLNRDGSGYVSYTVDMSRSRSNIEMITLLDSFGGYAIPSEQDIRDQVVAWEKKVATVKGIGDVSTQLNFESYVFTFKCRFDNLSALNRLLNIGNKPEQYIEYIEYDVKRKTLRRVVDERLLSMKSTLPPSMNSFLGDASYLFSGTFQSEVISSVPTPLSISDDKKSILVKRLLSSLKPEDQVTVKLK